MYNSKNARYLLAPLMLSLILLPLKYYLPILPVLAQSSTNQNLKNQITQLNQEGVKLLNQGSFQAALDKFLQVLALRREIKDQIGEGFTLFNIGNIYSQTREYSKALDYYQQALELRQKLGAKVGQIDILYKIADVYSRMGQYSQAVQFYQQALDISEEVGNRVLAADTLNSIGSVYRSLGQYGKAIEFHQQALNIARKNNDKPEENETLNQLGITYRHLGEYNKALENYNQALGIAQKLGNRFLQGVTLINIGAVYDYIDKYDQALENYQQALKIFQNTKHRDLEGITLSNIANVYTSKGDYVKGLELYGQALDITKKFGSRVDEASILSSIGLLYRQKGEYEKALYFYNQALAIQQEIGNKPGETITLSNIAYVFERQKNIELAITFYKKSINITEELRQSISLIPENIQKTYTELVENRYRRLADLLLKQNRIVEAQQIIDLLKLQEAKEYLNSSRGGKTTSSGVEFLPQEKEIITNLGKINDREIVLGKELTDLQKQCRVKCTTSQKQKILELEKLQQEISNNFINFIKSDEVKKIVEELDRTAQGQNLRLSHLNKLRNILQKDTVLLYPLILDDRIELILVSPYSPPIRRTTALKKEELTRQISKFRQTLTDPTEDTKKIANQFYQWFIQPIESDLQQAQAKNIIYAPDGKLRYIPLAAFHDGNQWLIQRFNTYNITSVSLDDLKTKRPSNLKALAGAFSQGNYNVNIGENTINFPGLVYAGKEVENLAKLINPTTKLLDKEFTPNAILSNLNIHNILHLATHAIFISGTPEESFILFGNGDKVTLRDIQKWNLPNIDLVVLSGCETGLGGRLGNGEEILGFSYLIQQAGAKATIASLWSVDDGGTQALMNEFYSVLQNPQITKSQALQAAQLALINKQNKNTDFSHPYYWAGFILIGNGL
jgi:CHAT domain-containing protein/Tfp pilus assembly protein PilF